MMLLSQTALLSACLVISASQPALFTDVTEESGIPPLKYSEGVSFQDLNRDGLPELYLPNVKGPDRLYKNLGGCRFEDVTEVSGIHHTGGIGAVFGDLDSDGVIDLFVVRGAYPYGLNLLYAGKGDGTFEDVSERAGVSSKINGISAVLGDIDNDGDLDAFVANWGQDTLYRNDSGPGRFILCDIADKGGTSESDKSWGAVFGDFDADGLPDLFVTRGGFGGKGESRLYINRGGGVFEDRTKASGIKGVSWSMGAVSCDFDSDGDLDLFVTCFDGADRLFLNDGKAVFRDATRESGIASSRSVGAAAGDVDGDLLPDLVVAGFAGPVSYYKNIGSGVFRKAGTGSGLGLQGKNEGIALADVDADGDLDLYVANYDGHNRLYRNNLDSSSYLKVRPVDGQRAAVGATVRLYEAEGPGKHGQLLAMKYLQAGFGFCSQAPMELLFRLPGDGEYELSVTFPGGAVVNKGGVGPGTLVVEKPAEAGRMEDKKQNDVD